MRSYQPTKRQRCLDIVLQYDSEKKEIGKDGFFSDSQRFLINQERAKIMSGDETFLQKETVETTILAVINQIQAGFWKPEKPIQYQ